MRRTLLPVFASLACIAVSAQQPPALLEEQLTRADAAFFGALFDRCDVEALAPMVAEDLEFFHDKWGQVAKSKQEFLASVRGMCERQRAGTDFRSRRALVPGTVAVYPMKGIGAFQTGSHRFFRLTEGKPEQPTETARFAHLWRMADGKWQLARVISYDHVDAPQSHPRR